MAKIRVLIVDDAVVVRQILTGLLSSDPEIEVAGIAANGRIALSKLAQVNPDVVTLDVEMPEMDGLATLREIRRISPTLPVIMFSTLTERGAAATIDALSAGASDYVTKPANVGSVATAIARIREQLIPKVKTLAAKAHGVRRPSPVPLPAPPPPGKAMAMEPMRCAPATTGCMEAVAIGVSTGGPNALSELLPRLPRDFPAPVFIVQHMPPMFTKLLADRLATRCQLKVCEAAHGQRAEVGWIYLAPGDFHMTVQRRGLDLWIELNQAMPENSCRPAVDVLFRSAAKTFGPRVLAVVLTGMGSDGLRGSQAIHDGGGRVLAQDEATSVVWGMPGFVAQAQLAEKVLPLDGMAAEIVRIAGAAKTAVRAAG